MESEAQLSQAEADELIALHKVGRGRYDFVKTDKLRVPLQSVDGRETFTLDLWRSGRIVLKRTHQLRGRRSIGLVRLDLAGPPHKNSPPGEERVPCPHLHIYREGFGLQWAFPVDPADFRDLKDPVATLADFLGFCQVVDPPDIQIGLYA